MFEMPINGLTVAMVQPHFSLNVGYVARVMGNFGLEKLVIVGNKKLGITSRTFASHGYGIVENAEYMSWRQLLEEFDFIIGTTAILSKGRNPLRTTLSPEQLANLPLNLSKSVLVLGRDTVGLYNHELASCDVVVTISTGTKYRTLNISHALAILLYVLSKHGQTNQNVGISRELKNAAMAYIESLLIKTGFVGSKKDEVKIIFKKLINGTPLNENQLSSFLGLLRQVDRRLG